MLWLGHSQDFLIGPNNTVSPFYIEGKISNLNRKKSIQGKRTAINIEYLIKKERDGNSISIFFLLNLPFFFLFSFNKKKINM